MSMCIWGEETTLHRDDPDLLDSLVMGGGGGLKAVLIYSCPDPTIPLRTRALKLDLRPALHGWGLDVIGCSSCVLATGVTTDKLSVRRFDPELTYCPMYMQHVYKN